MSLRYSSKIWSDKRLSLTLVATRSVCLIDILPNFSWIRPSLFNKYPKAFVYQIVVENSEC